MIVAFMMLLLQQAPAAIFNGPIMASTFVTPDGVPLATDNTRVLTYIVGCDNCGAISPFDDQKSFFANLYDRPLRIQEIRCYSNSGMLSINIQRNDGSPANILQTDLICAPSGGRSTAFVAGEDALSIDDLLDFVVVSADGVTSRAMISIKTRLN